MLTTEDLDTIVNMCVSTGNEDDGEPEEDEVNWVTSYDDEDPGDVFWLDTDTVVDRQVEEGLANSSFLHGSTFAEDIAMAMVAMDKCCVQKPALPFKGIQFDTCANYTSVISRSQYLSYCDEFGLKPSIRNANGRKLIGVGGVVKALGLVKLQIPFAGLHLVLDVDFLVIDKEIPTMMCLRDMYENDLDISIQEKYVSYGELRYPLNTENYFLTHRWVKSDMPFVLYTETQLRRIHRSFGHPSVRAMGNLLKRASDDNRLDNETRKAIQAISDDYKICLRTASPPRRFKLTLGTEDLRFNNVVQIGTMLIENRPVLHMVGEATHFFGAAFLRNQSTAEIWATNQRIWSLLYLGPPDFLTVDQGSAYVSVEMRRNLAAVGVVLREAPVESPEPIEVVERYHAPLRSAYNLIRADSPRDISDADCLKKAVFAVNCTVGPEGLCPVLLVFGSVPRPVRTKDAPTQI